MKILFVISNLNTGGVEKSLIDYINELSNRNEIHLLLIEQDFVDKNVFKNPIHLHTTSSKFKQVFNMKKASKYQFLLRCCNILKRNSYKKYLKKDYGYFDVAIAFNIFTPFGCYVVDKLIKSKAKIVFVHSDVRFWPINIAQIRHLKHFDKIMCVSKSLKKVFDIKYPNLSSKTEWIYNSQNIQEIRLNANQKIENIKRDKMFNIITVALLSPEKGIIRFLNVLKKLQNQNYLINYILVGGGPEYNNIYNYIQNNKIDNVIMLGNKSNPYPYFKNADLFVLPSYNEAFGMVIIESFALGVPVLSTNTCSAKEIIQDYGWVCENSEEDIYNELKHILDNTNDIKVKKTNLKDYNFDNKKNIARFVEIINNVN